MYHHDYEDYLDIERSNKVPSNGEAETVYDARNRSDCDTALCSRMGTPLDLSGRARRSPVVRR